MKQFLKVLLISAAIIVAILAIISAATAAKVFFIGTVKSVDTTLIDNITVTDTEIAFDIDSAESADMYKSCALRTDGDKLYIKIHTVLTDGNGGFARRVTVPYDLTGINEIYLEDENDTRLIWSREAR